MKKLIALIRLFFPPVYGIGLSAEEDIRTRNEWLGDDLDVWQGLAKGRPEPEMSSGIRRQLEKIRAMNKRVALVTPCAPTYLGISRPSGYKN
ncbi:MAG: hypothetical protein COU51_01625 [Parcubacteria group bacterium CG10_big_fil_rev_8_21_14_0_10_36_14]|nr:MAG: hypothetical protein COU51_01625 [Parcubacteria group bacterium CG10_big_fil_rev_8_21_14_0_10_36_14]